MRGRSLYILAGLIVLLAASIVMQWPHNKPVPRMPGNMEATQGKPDDPRGRAQFEFLRLRNPVTERIPEQIKERERQFARSISSRDDLIRMGKLYETEALTWTSSGPYNVGGRTRALGVDVDNNYILAGGVSGAMFRSTNGGQTWTNTTNPAALHSITCLVQDTRSGHRSTWYYGTGEYIGNSANGSGSAFYNGDGIYKSTDGGVTWNVLPSTFFGTPTVFDSYFDYIWNMALDPTNSGSGEIYVACWGALRRSTDGGNSWTFQLGGASPWSYYSDVAVTSSGVVYATMSSGGTTAGGSSGTDKGIWRSTNGTSWVNITPSGWPAFYKRTVIGIAPSNENVIYFLAETPGTGTTGHSLWKYTYLSGDGSGAGGSWENRSANLPASGGNTGDFDSQNSYDLLLRVKPNNVNTVFIGGKSLYRSTDGFATATNTTRIGGYATADDYSMIQNHFCDQHSLAFIPGSPDQMITGNDGGLAKTTNNTSATVVWSSLNKGYQTSQFYTVDIDISGHFSNSIVGGMQDNGTWITNTLGPTVPWSKMLSGDGSFCAIGNEGQNVFTSWQNGTIYVYRYNSNGNMLNWARIDPDGAQYNLFINPFVVDPNDGDIVYMIGRDRLWRCNDVASIPSYSNNPASASYWDELTQVAAKGDTMLTSVSVSTSNPANRVYYGTKEGKIYRIDNANSGNPVPTLSFTHPQGGFSSCIAIDPSNGDKALAVFSNYEVVSLYYTSNGGSSWTSVSGNLEEYTDGSGNGPSCRWACIFNGAGGTTYFVATSTGLYSTSNLNGGSTSWIWEGPTTIGNVVTDMVKCRASDGLIVAATHGKGIFTATAPTEVASIDPPEDFQLQGNYPNPFNPETTISYRLSRPAQVHLIVYDAAGRKVRSLIDRRMEAGEHRTVWDATDDRGIPVSSGVYIYRITAGEFSSSGKAILLR